MTLDGQTQSATIGTGGGFSTTFDVAALPVAGSPYSVSYAYTSDGTYASTTGTSTLTVNPAAAAVSVSDAGGVYDDSGYAASATVTGVGGASGASLEGVYPTLSYYSGTYTSPSQVAGLTPLSAAPVGVGAYTVLASFPGSPDYEAAAAVADFSIAQATPQVSVSDAGGTYGGTIPGATDSIAGVDGTRARRWRASAWR